MIEEMDLRHLRVMVSLANTLHFGKTAQALGLSQPTVSEILKDLERELGVMLVHRTRRSVRLSVAGHQFVLHASRGLAAVEDAALASRRAGEGEVGRLVLGLSAMSAMSVLPSVIARYRRRYPLVTLRLQSGGTSSLLSAVRDGRCDVAFVIAPGDLGALESSPLTRDRLVAVVPTRHRLAKQRTVRVEQFASEPMIHMPRDDEPILHDEYERMATAAGGTPDVILETNQLETMLACVAAGLGISFVPSGIRRLSFSGVRALDVVPRIPVQTAAVWDPESVSRPAERFLGLLPPARASR
jgi:DNA-binding transcriptional LysR family regulator